MGRLLERGDRVPDFVTTDASGTQARFYARAGGRPTILVVHADAGKATSAISGLPEDLDIIVVCVAVALKDAIPWFHDPDSVVCEAVGAQKGQGVAYVLDPNLRVLEAMVLDDTCERLPENVINAALTRQRGDVDADAIKVSFQAPVLLIPRILEEDKCRFLMDLWAQGGHEETGVETTAGGTREEVLSDEHKHRQDHTVTDPKLIRLLTSTIGRRVVPEVKRAFAYTATRFEGFKIACYNAESSGFFHAHRDNLSPATAHRQFALTLALNDEYEGGFLRFPEFGPNLYRLEAGTGVVFSCAHLHEVTAVTAGKRFALLTFLYDQERGQSGSDQEDPDPSS